MKYLLILLTVYSLSFAETMSPSEHNSLHTYNKRSTLKHNNEKKAHQLHKVDEEQATAIAQKICKTKKLALTLKHYSLYLYYHVTAEGCTLFINALDGSIIEPDKINKQGYK